MDKHICQEIEPLLPATAAGALDSEEYADILAHLAYCQFCTRKLREYEETVVQLAYAVPQSQPSAALKSQILALAAPATPVAETRSAEVPFQPRASGIPEPVPAETSGGLLGGLFGGLYRRIAPAALMMSVVLLVFSGSAMFSMSQQMDGMTQQLDGMRQTLSDTIEIKAMMATDGAMRAELKPKSDGEKSSGQVIMAPGKDQVVVMATNLPKPTSGKSYRLWILHRDAEPVAAGEIKVDDNGVAMCTVDVPEDPTAAEGIAVSEEAAGSPANSTVLLEGWYK